MKRDTRSTKTAAELMNELNADPEFSARRRRKNEVLNQKANEWQMAESEIVSDLRKVGENVQSVWDLVNTARPYPKAIPVLLNHLPRAYPDRVREGIARALTVPEARIGWRLMVDQFERDDDQTALGSKFAVGCALAAAATDDVMDEVIALIYDKRHGANRIGLLGALARRPSPKTISVLSDLKGDTDLSKEIRKILKCHPELDPSKSSLID